MKKTIILLMALTVIASAGTVVEISNFSSPDIYTNGLAWDGTYLWLLGGGNDCFYQLTTTGTVVDSFIPSEPGGDNGCGATFDGTNLWGLFIENIGVPGDIYEYQTDGTYVSDFTATGNYSFGLAWDGSSLWVSCRSNDNIYEFAPDGTQLSSFSSPLSSPYDLAYDGTNLWIISGSSLYEVTTTGTTVDTYSLSGIISTGVALTYDGDHIWASDQNTDIIYELETSHSSIQSTSLGSIKTLFE